MATLFLPSVRLGTLDSYHTYIVQRCWQQIRSSWILEQVFHILFLLRLILNPRSQFLPSIHTAVCSMDVCLNKFIRTYSLETSSSKKWASMHSHVLPRGRSRVWVPARAHWTQRSNLTRKYLFPSNQRSQTGRAWLVLVGNPKYCCVWPKLVSNPPTWWFWCRHWPRVRPITAQGLCVGGVLRMVGWEYGEWMFALPLHSQHPCIQ